MYWLLLAEGHLTRRLFGAIVQRLATLSGPRGAHAIVVANLGGKEVEGGVSEKSAARRSRAKYRGSQKDRTDLRVGRRAESGRKTGLDSSDGRNAGTKTEISVELLAHFQNSTSWEQLAPRWSRCPRVWPHPCFGVRISPRK